MLKIVDVHASEGVRGEYVVLQNLGLITVCLRGWALCTDAYLHGNGTEIADQMYVFRDEINVNPYMRVVLFSGCGHNGWMPTIDGQQAYCAYWNRDERIWTDTAHIHVLQLSCSRRIKGSNNYTAVSL